MGWTQTAPSVKAWEQEKSTTWQQNYFTITTKQYIGRTSGKGFAVKVEFTLTQRQSGYTPQYSIYLSAQVGSAAAVVDTSIAMPGYGETVTIYYTDEAAVGETVTTIVGWSNSTSSRQTLTFTAPKLLGGQFYVNVGGSWKQATAYINVGGTWKEAQAKINAGGEWK